MFPRPTFYAQARKRNFAAEAACGPRTSRGIKLSPRSIMQARKRNFAAEAACGPRASRDIKISPCSIMQARKRNLAAKAACGPRTSRGIKLSPCSIAQTSLPVFRDHMKFHLIRQVLSSLHRKHDSCLHQRRSIKPFLATRLFIERICL